MIIPPYPSFVVNDSGLDIVPDVWVYPVVQQDSSQLTASDSYDDEHLYNIYICMYILYDI